MLKNKKVVVVGGGAIGLSVAYHLGKLGLTNVVLLERDQLTSGTSWHAAGIVGPLRSSKSLTELAQYGIRLFKVLEQETGLSTGYQQTGGLWLAQQPQRLIELKRIAAMGAMHQLQTQMLSPAETAKKFPMLNVDDLVGALWVEEDGQINPVDLCMAYAKGARQLGVEIREQARVVKLSHFAGRVSSVYLSDGSSIEAEAVINCAGLWATELGAMVGVEAPVRAVEHIYLVSETAENLPKPCPILRDLDSAIYLKGDAGKLVLGTFENNPKLWRSAGAANDGSFIEFAEDWDHIEPMMQAGIHRVPALAELGVTRVMNGPESFTPDTKQVMGRAKGLENFYVAAGFNSIGIMSSAGVGKVMAEWVKDAHPPMDLWEVDILRFSPDDSCEKFLDARIPEAVHNQFSIHWPLKQYRTGRNRKQSVWHTLLADQGAVFGAPTGWERPLWFAKSKEEKGFDYSYGKQPWWPYAEREARQLMDTGAVFELSPFTKHILSGDNVASKLQKLCTRSIDVDIGRLVYTLMLNHRGGIEIECTVTRLEQDRFLIVSGAATRQKDNDWLHNALPDSVAIDDVTDDYAVLGVMGPQSGNLLGSLGFVECSISEFPFSSSQMINIAGVLVRASRVSYVGEKGWELMVGSDDAIAIMSAVIAEMSKWQIGFAGHLCLDSCRLEKNYVHWGHDIGTQDTPQAAGLEFAMARDRKFRFIGDEKATRTENTLSEHRRVLLEVVAERPLLLHDEPVYMDGVLVGRTTSGGIGFRCNKALSMAMLENHNFLYSAEYQIEVAGERFTALPLKRSPYDPQNLKLRLD